MKLKHIPIKNPIGWGIAAGAILLVSSPKVRRKVREYVVKGVSTTMGLTNKVSNKMEHWSDMATHEPESAGHEHPMRHSEEEIESIQETSTNINDNDDLENEENKEESIGGNKAENHRGDV
jgi:hypothetical protein